MPPGCSQSVLSNAMFVLAAAPFFTVVLTACLCAWVDINQNFEPVGVVQVPVAVTPFVIAGIRIDALYVVYAAVLVNAVAAGSASALSVTWTTIGWSLG